MADDAIIAHVSRKNLIEKYSYRLERLFGVKVRIRENDQKAEANSVHQNADAIRCYISGTDTTQDRIQKAKECLLSISNNGHVIESLGAFGKEDLEMILSQKDFLEREWQTVLDIVSDSGEILVCGKKENISLVKAFVENMVQVNLKEEVRDSNYGEEGNRFDGLRPDGYRIALHEMDSVEAGGLPLGGRDFFSDLCNIKSPNDLQTDSEPDLFIDRPSSGYVMSSRGCSASPCLTQDRRSDSLLELTSDDFQRHGFDSQSLNIQSSSIAQLRRINSPSDTDTSDNEDEMIQSDPDYQNKVEFALKLGYSENQLLNALRKLGATAGQNELLSELIKLGSSVKPPPPPECVVPETVQRESLSSPGEVLEDFMALSFTYQREDVADDGCNLRPVVIDGSNVAMSHGNKEIFSCRGILLAVEWFRQRGHKDITVFVPQWRKETSRPDARIKDQEILTQLEKEKVLVFTPARRIGGKRVVCYDDRYVLKLAAETSGIVVSNDNYRDLLNESPEFKKVVEERLLMYSFVNDRFMPPDDPLGRHGPSLDNFLQKEPTQPEPLPPPCPYGSKKCTYGNKCKYYHPERRNMPQKSVTEKLAEQAKQRILEVKERTIKDKEVEKKKVGGKQRLALQRTRSLVSSDSSQGDSSSSQLSGTDFPGNPTSSSLGMTEEEERCREYNKKLSDQLEKLKMEESRQDERSNSEEFQNKAGVYGPLSWGGSTHTDNSRSSPLSNLSVPLQQPYSNPEGFLSGHLLLAKKLSDEANETDRKNKKSGERESSPLASPQKPNDMKEESSKQKPRAITKQKLSRQYSLQGKEDPRLKPSLQPQISCDPMLLGKKDTIFHSADYHRSVLKDDFMQSQTQPDRLSSYPLSAADAARSGARLTASPDQPRDHSVHYTQDLGYPQHHPLVGDIYNAHNSLARMQSAPDSVHPQHNHIRLMARQNSTSDPQLHKPDEDDDSCFSGGQMSSRGTMPLQDSSGTVRFQIGNSQPVRPMVYNRSASVIQPPYHHGPFMQDVDTFRHYPSQFGDIQQHQRSPNQGRIQIPYNRSHSTVLPQQFTQPPPFVVHHQQHQHQTQRHPSFASDAQPSFSPVPPNPGISQGIWPEALTLSKPPPETQGIPEDAPILVGDHRYNLYYHLCGLFPEKKVRAVMNTHPSTTDPNEICAYIIGAK